MILSNIVKNKSSFKTPWLVCYISITILAQFFLINYKDHFHSINPETFTIFGAPDTVDIYKGKYWGVFTNNFIHIYWNQLIINLIGIWLFGAFIERRSGRIKLLFLIIISSIIPSLWQLTLTAEPGIGLSGVNYALFGFILSKSQNDKKYKLKGRYLILTFMISILIYCNYINYFVEDIYRTEAMTIGLLLGIGIEKLDRSKLNLRALILFSVCLVSISTLFYAPWSSEWQVYKGIRFHESKNYVRAKIYYRKALKIDSNNKQAIENINLLKIDELKSKAYKAHIKGKYDIAKKYYLKVLEIDPNDTWTKENLHELP
jgi:membrane associated rhomboid family serine protease